MHVLLINGSPHTHGCTYTALAEIANTLNEAHFDTEIFSIGHQAVRGCIACGQCRQNGGHCVFEEDVANILSQKMQAADGIVIGSPVYFAGPNGALCALLDRIFYMGGNYRGKPACAIASCRRGGLTSTFDRLNKYFTINQMPIVSSQYWNGVHGNTPDEIRQDKEGLQIMRTLGRNMAWMLTQLVNAPLPPLEPRKQTNFIH